MKIRLNDNIELVNEVKNKLKNNKEKYGKQFCPCVIPSKYNDENNDDYVCMCKEFREQESGECHCGLYIKTIDDTITEVKNNELYFAKVKPDAIIPTKEEENAGRDVYACFDEDYIIIPAFTTKLIPTGIASAMSPKYEIRLRDRGSNGSKGIHVNAGTIDSGFRGEWFVAWDNTNDRDVILSKLPLKEVIKKYKYDKDDDFDELFSEFVEIPLNPMDKNGEKFTIIDSEHSYGVIFYPYTKAIAQAEVCEVPKMDEKEISYEELKNIPSKRGTGALGSSGK